MTHGAHVTPRGYLLTLGVLLLLTAVSFSLSYVKLEAFEMPIAIAIAVSKATLVVLYFMHLIEQPFSNQFTAIIAVVFVVVLLLFAVADILTRAPPPGLALP